MIKLNDNIVLFKEQRQLVAKVTDPVAINGVWKIPLPKEAITRAKDGVYVALPWSEESCKILQNVGIDSTIAAPLLFDDHPLIEGKYKPMAHQLFTAAFVSLNPRSYILSDPRTGKTGSLILAMDYMQRTRMVTGAFLIITTVTTMQSVWMDGILGTLPDARVEIVSRKTRENVGVKPADFYITNYDSIRLAQNAFTSAVRSGFIGGCVIDELTHVGNVSSQRHKAIDAVVNKTGLKYVIGVTGSPGENPDMVFGMCKVINRDKLPCLTKTGWMGMTTYQYGSAPYMRKPSREAPNIIHKTMQPAVRFNKYDIIDLPPIVTQNRECPLSKEQARVIKEFRTHAVALVESGEKITAANGGVLYQKLMQSSQGFVMSNDGTPRELDHADRTKVLLDIIDETDRKVVVFACYKAIIAMRKKEFEDAGHTVEVIDGSVSANERARILKDFQEKKNPRILIAHPTTTSFGVELSAADTMVFDGPPPLGGFIYAQALERLSSVKQTANKISVIRVFASPEEKKFFISLDKGKEMGNFIATLFEDMAKGDL